MFALRRLSPGPAQSFPMKKLIPPTMATEKPPVIGFMTVALQNLLRLQTLDFEQTSARGSKAQVAELRNQIPSFILDRYDRLRARDKKALAIVLNCTCTACHMRQPTGKMAALIRGEEIQACDSCGRYLLLPELAGTMLAASARAVHAGARGMASSRVAR